jgi:ABC-type spermidine/putrescine transport system permease subunit II
MAIPLVVVTLFSFNASESLSSFEGTSLRWYEQVFSSETIRESLWASIEIALVTTLIAVPLGTGLAFAFVRGRRKVVRPVEGVSLLTLVTPEIATAIGLLTLFSFVNTDLSKTTVVLGHVTFSLAFVMVVVRSRLVTIARDLEEAAMDLGASPLATFRLIVVPQLAPAIGGAALLVFVLSFDDFVTSLFLSGPDVSPLPLRIYGMLRFGLTPEVNAIGTIMMVLSIGIGLTGLWFTRRRHRGDAA